MYWACMLYVQGHVVLHPPAWSRRVRARQKVKVHAENLRVSDRPTSCTKYKRVARYETWLLLGGIEPTVMPAQ